MLKKPLKTPKCIIFVELRILFNIYIVYARVVFLYIF